MLWVKFDERFYFTQKNKWVKSCEKFYFTQCPVFLTLKLNKLKIPY